MSRFMYMNPTVKHKGLIFVPIKGQEQVHQNHQWGSGFFPATKRITVIENFHKACDDMVCQEKIFYSKHFCLFLLNYILVVIIFLS